MPPTQSPGPASAALKPLIGYQNHEFNSLKQRAPQWSMGGRPAAASDKHSSPGPASGANITHVTRFGLSTVPTATMKGRPKELGSHRGPGPQYDVVDASLYKARAPTYSLRERTKLLVGSGHAAPLYGPTQLDVYRPRAPLYQMRGRLNLAPRSSGPGPDHYGTEAGTAKLHVMQRPPVYSLRIKPNDASSIAKRTQPAPADYNLMNHLPSGHGPAFSMGVKHSQYQHIPVVPMDNC